MRAIRPGRSGSTCKRGQQQPDANSEETNGINFFAIRNNSKGKTRTFGKKCQDTAWTDLQGITNEPALLSSLAGFPATFSAELELCGAQLHPALMGVDAGIGCGRKGEKRWQEELVVRRRRRMEKRRTMSDDDNQELDDFQK